jgi:hypothetical protein
MDEDRLSRAFLLALLVGLGRERPAIDGAHLARELAGGQAACVREPARLVLRRRHAREQPRLGPGELAAGEGLREGVAELDPLSIAALAGLVDGTGSLRDGYGKPAPERRTHPHDPSGPGQPER